MTSVGNYYVALGDSMSIDLYPRLDLQGRGWDVAEDAGVGAAALFHRNDDALWPEFAGRDLRAITPGIERLDRCVDGATIGHTLDEQLPRVGSDVAGEARVVTITAGGNDLLGGLFDGLAGLESEARRAAARYPSLGQGDSWMGRFRSRVAPCRTPRLPSPQFAPDQRRGA